MYLSQKLNFSAKQCAFKLKIEFLNFSHFPKLYFAFKVFVFHYF